MKYNRSQIMKDAWEMVKRCKMTISAALKYAWAAVKGTLKQLNIKDWFLDKIACEKRMHLHSTEIFAVLRETEKAYNVMLCEYGRAITCWVPKSCTYECPGCIDFHTRFGIGYDAARAELNYFWNSYR